MLALAFPLHIQLGPLLQLDLGQRLVVALPLPLLAVYDFKLHAQHLEPIEVPLDQLRGPLLLSWAGHPLFSHSEVHGELSDLELSVHKLQTQVLDL